MSTVRPELCHQTGNGNVGGEVGAVGTGLDTEGAGDEEPSALIEGCEGDMVAVDSPDMVLDDISRWFKVVYLCLWD